MKINLFGYYGVLITKPEITSFMVKTEDKDLYTFIMKHQLEYRDIGNMYKGYKIIVGKEIIWDFDFNLFKFKVENGIMKFQSNIGEDYPLLKPEEQLIVKTKLAQIGVYSEPEYYIFTNYGS